MELENPQAGPKGGDNIKDAIHAKMKGKKGKPIRNINGNSNTVESNCREIQTINGKKERNDDRRGRIQMYTSMGIGKGGNMLNCEPKPKQNDIHAETPTNNQHLPTYKHRSKYRQCRAHTTSISSKVNQQASKRKGGLQYSAEESNRYLFACMTRKVQKVSSKKGR